MKKYSTAAVLVAGCLTVTGLVGCSSSVKGTGSRNGGSTAVTQASPSVDSQSGDPAGSGVPSMSGSAGESAPGGSSRPGSSTGSQPNQGGGTTIANPPPPSSPSFHVLTLSTGSPKCVAGGGPTTEPAIITWRVSNATGIAVGIDDVNFGDATQYPGASGTQTVTNIQCMGSQKYTFDIWTTGGPNGRAHRQLSLTGPSGTPPPASFQNLSLKNGPPSCGSGTNPSSAPEVLTWQLSNATGIAVGIDDSNFGDATQYSGASGTQVLTNVGCHGSQSYTFDIWTTGGSGAQAHKQLSFTGPA